MTLFDDDRRVSENMLTDARDAARRGHVREGVQRGSSALPHEAADLAVEIFESVRPIGRTVHLKREADASGKGWWRNADVGDPDRGRTADYLADGRGGATRPDPRSTEPEVDAATELLHADPKDQRPMSGRSSRCRTSSSVDAAPQRGHRSASQPCAVRAQPRVGRRRTRRARAREPGLRRLRDREHRRTRRVWLRVLPTAPGGWADARGPSPREPSPREPSPREPSPRELQGRPGRSRARPNPTDPRGSS